MRFYSAWQDLLHLSVPALKRPAAVFLCCTGQSAFTSFSDAKSDKLKDENARIVNKPSINAKADTVYSEEDRSVKSVLNAHPAPVYEGAPTSSTPFMPTPRRILYYALATASIVHIPKIPLQSSTAKGNTPSVQPSGYALHVLSSVSHPLSSYNLPLSRHISDVTQSFVNLQALAKHRWSITNEDGEGVDVLPWHLAAVSIFSSYTIDACLPREG